MRLIDADELKEDIEQQCALLRLMKDNDELIQISMVLESGFMAQIDKMPTIEPRCETCEAFNKTRLLIPQPERKKGKWIPHKELSREYIGSALVSIRYDYWYCDCCGYKVENGQPIYNYCPNCGARMER